MWLQNWALPKTSPNFGWDRSKVEQGCSGEAEGDSLEPEVGGKLAIAFCCLGASSRAVRDGWALGDVPEGCFSGLQAGGDVSLQP